MGQELIFSVEGGDVTLFRTIERAEMKCEAIDVLNGAYVFYDANGAILSAEADLKTERVMIGRKPSTEKCPEELMKSLRGYLAAVGSIKTGIQPDRLNTMSLPELVETMARLEMV